MKVKYKAKQFFKSKWHQKTDSHFFDALRYVLMKDYPKNLDFQREYLNFPIPEEPVTFIPEKRIRAIPFDKYVYIF
ncbi:hypothetical protein [Chryseobacterium sp. 2R14A]|uniref:hypothetical protein n=1 Tax=Chryseobacterium sp. 2R14A TaxID=3380353 RepID=UPI003CFA79BD